MAEMNLKGMLTKKLGPLPAWGWGLVIGGGYLGYRVLSGKGISLTGTTGTVETAAVPEYTGGGYSGPGSAYGEGGEVPTTIEDDTESATTIADLTAELAAQKAYTQKIKDRKSDWADYARRWRAIAKRRANKTGASNIARGSDKPKTKRTKRKTKRVGTSGTWTYVAKTPSPIRRAQGHTTPGRVRDRRDPNRRPGQMG